MPGGDGSGPMREGPMTGGGFGPCGTGRGRSFRGGGFRGRGFGGGGGRGLRLRGGASEWSGLRRNAGPRYQAQPVDEQTVLEREAEYLGQELKAIKARISEIAGAPKE